VPLERLLRRLPETLGPDASCSEAAERMRDGNVGAIVVVEAGRPIGVVTDRDIAVRVVAEGLSPDATALRDVMSGQPIFLSEERPLDQAVAAMRDLSVRRIPVVDADGKLAGVVAMDDLIVLLSEQLGSLAEAIRREIAPPRS
jgi:CBS domain-containing protein